MVDLIKSTAPSAFGAAVAWYEAALSGLKGATTFAFEGSATAYRDFMQGRFADIADPALRQIAMRFASGEAIQGGMQNDGFAGSEIADVMVGGKGDDVLVGAGGSDIYVYARGDGNDWIVDRSTAAGETDTLVLRDLNRADVTFSRMGNTRIVTVTATGQIEGRTIIQLKQTRCATPRNTGSATSGSMHQGRVPSSIAKPWETRGQRHQAGDIKLVS